MIDLNWALRLFIAAVAGMVGISLMSALTLLFLDEGNLAVSISASFGAGCAFTSYYYIKPMWFKQRQIKHPEGPRIFSVGNVKENLTDFVKEKGKLVNGKREGVWDFFDDQGAWICSKKYSNDEEVM